jgi:hypothetical protein
VYLVSDFPDDVLATLTQPASPRAVTAVGTPIHKGYCSPHLAAAGHTTTGSRVEFKFPELLGSTSYDMLLIHAHSMFQ